MPEETKQAITEREIHEAITALQTTVKNIGTDSFVFKDLQEKVEKALVHHDDENQKLVLSQKKAEKEALELKEQVKALELEVAKGPTIPGMGFKDMPEYKAINTWVRCGGNGLSNEEFKLLAPILEIKTMRTDTGPSGGFLAPPSFDAEIIKGIIEVSPMRSIARSKTSPTKTVEQPTRTAIMEAFFEGEAEAAQQGKSAYGNETMTTHRLTVQVPLTVDQLRTPQFDIENEVGSDISIAFSKKEGNKFILGSGAKQPEGFLVNSDVDASRISTVSGSLAPIDLINLTGDLIVGYNPVFTFNRRTLATLRTLQDGSGAFIWHRGDGRNAGQAGSIPNDIAGEPYVVMPDMANLSAGSKSIAYGDFFRAYKIIDWLGMEMVRDDVTQALNAIVLLTFRKWVTGQVVLAEAIKVLTTKTP